MCLGAIGTVTKTWDEGGLMMAEVECPHGSEVACLAYVPQAMVDDQVLVHIGFAIEVLDKADAAEALRLRSIDRKESA